jgi:hypothetical protein
VGSMIRGSAKRVTLIVSRLKPAGSWRYEAGKRDLRLDLLRGFAVVAMVADHIGGERSWLYALTGGDAFWVSAAEVFVFISGLLLGMISAGLMARHGLGVALMKSLQRTWTLYLLTVTLTLSFIALSAQLDLRWGPELASVNWTDLIVSVMTLHRTFYLTDILLLYTLLILTAVPVLVLLTQGHTRWVLVGSWGLWTLWQLAPQHAQFPWAIADNSVFNFPAWQVLFVTAMAIGYHRQQLEGYVTWISERLLLVLSGAIVATAIVVYLSFPPALMPAYTWLVDQLFGKVDLRIGRLFVFASFFTFAISLLTLAWKPICRTLGWLLLPLGQDALSAYILHLFVVAIAVKVRPMLLGISSDNSLHHTLFQLAGVAFIWTALMLRPMLTAAFHAWLARGTALLAAGRAHLSPQGYLGRDL